MESLFAVLGLIWPILLSVAVAALLERIIPWRKGPVDRLRWLHAGLLYVFGILIVFVLFPLGHAEAALLANERDWGLMNVLGVPLWLAVPIGVLLLDLTDWGIHLVLHRVPALWRLHRVHHSDETMDISTALRFHPLEMLIRFIVALGVVLLLGLPVLSVAIAAVLLIVFNAWEHANVPVPAMLRPMSKLLITPELHRIHHSDRPEHMGRNLGTVFSVWDRLFGTLAQDDAERARFGLGPGTAKNYSSLLDLLIDPARRV